MNLRRFVRDEDGSAVVEFGLTAPAFMAALLGAIGCGILVWTQIGLQHATEMAARCASVNTNVCNSTAAIQTYAAQEAFGLSVAPSAFTVSAQSCGSQVAAAYVFPSVFQGIGLPSVTLRGQACFPK